METRRNSSEAEREAHRLCALKRFCLKYEISFLRISKRKGERERRKRQTFRNVRRKQLNNNKFITIYYKFSSKLIN